MSVVYFIVFFLTTSFHFSVTVTDLYLLYITSKPVQDKELSLALDVWTLLLDLIYLFFELNRIVRLRTVHQRCCET